MDNKQDNPLVLSSFREEMARRSKVGRYRQVKALIGIILALALLWYAIQPIGLDLWHQIALFASVIWLLMVASSPAYELADEMDLLEKKIVERLKQIDKES